MQVGQLHAERLTTLIFHPLSVSHLVANSPRSKENRAPRREDRGGDRGAAFTDRQLGVGPPSRCGCSCSRGRRTDGSRPGEGRAVLRRFSGGSPGLSGSVRRPDVRSLPGMGMFSRRRRPLKTGKNEGVKEKPECKVMILIINELFAGSLKVFKTRCSGDCSVFCFFFKDNLLDD